MDLYKEEAGMLSLVLSHSPLACRRSWNGDLQWGPPDGLRHKSSCSPIRKRLTLPIMEDAGRCLSELHGGKGTLGFETRHG